jgi:hypothetical protein
MAMQSRSPTKHALTSKCGDRELGRTSRTKVCFTTSRQLYSSKLELENLQVYHLPNLKSLRQPLHSSNACVYHVSVRRLKVNCNLRYGTIQVRIARDYKQAPKLQARIISNINKPKG